MRQAFLTALAAALLAASPAPALTVHISNFAFSPANATIVAGQSITFVNEDQVAHTVTADDKSFDSGDMEPGKSWTHTFANPGTYKYTCIYHFNMNGTVTVKPSS